MFMRLSHLLLAAGLLFGATASFAQTNQPFTESRTAEGVKVLKGKPTLQTFMSDSAFRWFYTGVNRYQPNTAAAVDFLKAKREKFNITVIIGTWDATSQEAFPKLTKVLLQASYPAETMEIFCVDQHNEAGVTVPYKFKKIPTVVVSRNGKEVGRIVGDPTASNYETELSKIVFDATRNDKPDPNSTSSMQ